MPRALGKFRGFEALYNKICGDCNASFGRQLEDDFAHASPEAFFREWLAIRGRPGHRKVNPVYHRTSSTQRLQVLGRDPDTGTEILWEVLPGAVQRARQIIVKSDNGKLHPIPIPDHPQPEILRRILHDKQLLAGHVIMCYVPADQRSSMLQLIRAVFPSFEPESDEPVGSGQVIQLELVVKLYVPYFRAVSKIAFHYFLKCCTQFTGEENEFQPIKDFIRTGGNWNDFIELPAPPIVEDSNALGAYNHLTAIDVSRFEIRVRLQFFVGSGHLPPVWGVRIGPNASRLCYEQRIGHRFRYYEEGESDAAGNDGEMREIQAIRHIIPAKIIPGELGA